MKKLKVFKELNTEMSKVPSKFIDDSKLTNAFTRLKEELGITKEIHIADTLYLQPFKLEYVNVGGGIKDYFVVNKQREERSNDYCKLVVKRDKKLNVVKSFGRVFDLSDDTFEMLVLLIRLTQYIHKNRELYSLEISILQLLKDDKD